MICVCTNILSAKRSYFRRKEKKREGKKGVCVGGGGGGGYDFNACNTVRDILYNTDDINSIVNLIVHCPVGKLA